MSSDHDRPGARLRDRAAVHLRPQELLLSGPLQGLPDLPVRHPALPRRASGRRAHPPDPPRGGRGQARARRRRPAASTAPTASLVDFNRAGTPLAEIVTEPDIHSAEQASDFLQLLRETLRQLGVSRREHGGGPAALRRQRLHPPRRPHRARHQDRGQEHELVPLRDAGHQRRDRAPDRDARGRRAVVQETLHFDPVSGRISSLRSKEEAHDYRYFPEPDLVPLVPTPEMLETARARDPRAPRRAHRPLRRRLRAARGHRAPVRVPARVGLLLRAGRLRRAGREGDRDLGDRAALPRRCVGPARVAGQARDAGERQDRHRRRGPDDPRQAGRRAAATRPRSPSAKA